MQTVGYVIQDEHGRFLQHDWWGRGSFDMAFVHRRKDDATNRMNSTNHPEGWKVREVTITLDEENGD